MSKKWIAWIVAVVVAVASIGAWAAPEMSIDDIINSVINTTTDASQVDSPFIRVIDQVKGSVVGVYNYQIPSAYTAYDPFSDFFGFSPNGRSNGRSREQDTTPQLASRGSGVVVYEHLVVTNYHVVEDAASLTVVALDSDLEYRATVLASDKDADVAVLYVPDLDLPAVPMGDSEQIQVGEYAICIGNPVSGELAGTVTIGTISAMNRQINTGSTTDKYGLKTAVVTVMIQTDASINAGNSGGGLFNVLGQLMGIPSIKYSGQTPSGVSIEGIGMAIPINTAKPMIKQALRKMLSGDVGEATVSTESERLTTTSDNKPLLGVTLAAINASNNNAVRAGVLPAGLQVDSVNEGQPAQLGGIQTDDIIVEADGEIVTTVEQLKDILNSKQFGDILPVKVYRVEGLSDAVYVTDIGKGEYIDLDVKLFDFSGNT